VRTVFDTNVLVSGLFWRGPPHVLLERVRDGAAVLISSPALLAELAEVLEEPKFETIFARSDTSRERSLAEIQALAEVISPEPLPAPVCRDPDDDEILALALAARANLIVSGDSDLLALHPFQHIPILSPIDAVRRIDAPRE
jgi:putative PIN family toxin of toxin-antitoxin system